MIGRIDHFLDTDPNALRKVATVCSVIGVIVLMGAAMALDQKAREITALIAFLAFIFVMIGAILFILDRKTRPRRSRKRFAGRG